MAKRRSAGVGFGSGVASAASSAACGWGCVSGAAVAAGSAATGCSASVGCAGAASVVSLIMPLSPSLGEPPRSV